MPFSFSRLLVIFSLLLSGLGSASAGNVHTASLPPGPPDHLDAVGSTNAPIGHVQFCGEHPNECKPTGPRVYEVVLTEAKFSELRKVNRSVNESVEPVTDLEQWGVTELWSYPDTGKGDCEDYVLEKRRVLMNLGWPASALLITVVRDKAGDGHAVLTVVTDRGDMILDNQAPDILRWRETGYRYVKRQSQNDPAQWVSLGDSFSPPVVGGGR
ncbi:transglutaminase-like cysteine peptidase [Xanthobacteraceae bacterium A53D]